MNESEPPAPDVSARPKRKTLCRWLRGAGYFFVLLIGGLVLLREYIDWSGRRHWAAVRQMLDAEGESLDIRKVAPGPVPDDENFCAIPALKNLAAIPEDADPKTPEGAQRARLMAVMPSRPEDAEIVKARKNGASPDQILDIIMKNALKEVNSPHYVPEPAFSEGAILGKPLDLPAWVAWLHFAGWLSKPAGPGPAQDVLAALSRDDSLVNELAGGTDRPESQWTPAWSARVLPAALTGMTYPQFPPTTLLANALCLRSVAAAQAGDGANAHKSLLIAVRLNEAAMKEPMVIGTLVACGASVQIGNAVWELCDAHCGDTDGFRKLQEALTRLDYRKAYLLASRGELAFVANTFSVIESRRELPSEASVLKSGFARTALDIISNGWLEQNEAVASQWRYTYYIKPLRDGHLGDLVASQAVLADLIAKKNGNYYSRFSELLALIGAPAFFGVTYRVIYAQSLLNESIAACALERYRIEHGAYPDTLEAADHPGEQAIPLDVISGKPMGYRKTPDGRYLLWCVALSGTDHGGRRAPDPVPPARNHIQDPSYGGDWVWSFSPN